MSERCGSKSQDGHDPYKVNSPILSPEINPLNGIVRWDPARSIWNGSILAAALILEPMYTLGNRISGTDSFKRWSF